LNYVKSKEIKMIRKASAVWNGGLRGGNGRMSSASGVLDNTQYSFSTRFENGIGTNPEELLAAAHAGCFSMALSAELERAELTPESVSTNSTLTFEKTDAGFTITKIHLNVVAKVPGADGETFAQIAESAKSGCPVSRALNTEITMDAKLG
jgi:osmotically inducible protein OsmC